MCQQQNIKIINHTDTINPSKHLNESLFHLNRYGGIEFADNFKKKLCNLDSRDIGNSEGLDHYEAIFQILLGIRFIMIKMKFLVKTGMRCQFYILNITIMITTLKTIK